ncbi:MAG: cytochrome c [bacterium]|nr:cytochrome c [bacterium]
MRKNILLSVVLLALVALHWAIPSDRSQRTVRFFPDMADSQAYESQAPTATTSDYGDLDLRPPAGSIARGFSPFPYDASPEDALRAGLELNNPLSADDPSVASRGATVFATFCAVCHGLAGAGDGTVTPKGVPPPPSLHAQHALDLADGQIFHIITHGQKNMASYAAQVDRTDRWRLVSYIRELQTAETTRLEREKAAAEAAARQSSEPASDDQPASEVLS